MREYQQRGNYLYTDYLSFPDVKKKKKNGAFEFVQAKDKRLKTAT